jgi:hypothetical protein
LNKDQLIGQACSSRGCPRLKQPLPADINARYLPIRQEGLGKPEAVISISAGGVETARGPAAEGFKWKRRYGGAYGLLGKAVHGRGQAEVAMIRHMDCNKIFGHEKYFLLVYLPTVYPLNDRSLKIRIYAAAT